jgi:beta-lactamase class A
MFKKCAFLLIAAMLFGAFARAQEKDRIIGPPAKSPALTLEKVVAEAAETALRNFAAKGLRPDQFALTLIDLRDPNNLRQADYRGEEKIYPASVSKMFYLAAAHRWLQDGKLKDSPELRQTMREMIVDSWNEPTQYIIDLLTGTTSGPPLSEKEMKKWAEKRNVVNRYFASLGYKNINLNQKVFCEASYGREKVFRGPNGENRNKLTTNATARLLSEIVLGRAVSPQRSAQMLELMKRDQYAAGGDNDDQARGFTGIALKDKPGVKLWSKAGWTSETRHDAAYIETPDGLRFVLVTFTTDHAKERDIIPTVARAVLEGLGNR